MPSLEIKFDVSEQLKFDRVFPPAEVEAFEQEPTDDWVDIFEALSAFGLPQVRPEGKKLVAEKLLAHRYGPAIMVNKTESGIKVFRRNITPLLKAAQDIFIECFDQWSQEQLDALSLLLSTRESRINAREEDWKK